MTGTRSAVPASRPPRSARSRTLCVGCALLIHRCWRPVCSWHLRRRFRPGPAPRVNVASVAAWSGVRCSRTASPGVSNRTSTMALLDGASMTVSTTPRRSYRPLSPPTRLRTAPVMATLKIGRRPSWSARGGPPRRRPRRKKAVFAVDEQDGAVAAHHGGRRPGAVERRYSILCDQDVVEGERDLPVGRRPAAGSAGSTMICPYRPICRPSSRTYGWYQYRLGSETATGR